MKTKQNAHSSRLTCLRKTASILGLCLATLAATAGQRSVDDFLAVQGTWCLNLDNDGNLICPSSGANCYQQNAPAANFVDWTDPFSNSSVSFDYAGLVNKALNGSLGTMVSGTINETVQKDGSARVTVLLTTKNALVWAHTGIGFNLVGTAPLLFGHRPAEVQAGAQASLGDCTLKVVLKESAPGKPFPDLLQVAACGADDWSLESLSFSGRSDGTLANGSAGHLEVTEVGLLTDYFKQTDRGVPSRVALDAFPAEHVDIKPAGK